MRRWRRWERVCVGRRWPHDTVDEALTPTWRIAFYDAVGGCEVVEVVRKYRPMLKARAMLRREFIRFEIEQVA